MTPGFVSGMPDETYHADPVDEGSLSSTFARLLTDHVPAKAVALRRDRKPTKSMNIGKAAHAHALGAGPALIVWQYDGRTKDGKAERERHASAIASESAVAVTATERAQIMGMAEALRSHWQVAEILEASDAEVSAFWEQDDVWCRARYDLLGPVGSYDYKTCEDATSRGFSKSMAAYGYHQQADFYQRGLRALDHPEANIGLRFICQETTAPYLVQIHEPDADALAAAKALNDRAIRIFGQCNRSGEWPGFPTLVSEPTSLPAYYFFNHADALDETDYAYLPPSTELKL